MQKKVEMILSIVKKTYQQCSKYFHEYYKNEFTANIISLNLHNKQILNFNDSIFSKFVDECMMYRLGITVKEPRVRDVVYDLSADINPEIYSIPLDTVLEKLIYSAVPVNLINELKSRIEGYDLDEAVVDLIISKLE